MTADIVVDQLLAGGCVRSLVSSFVGNSAAGSLGELRRRVERGAPEPLEFTEYSHGGMIGRYLALARAAHRLRVRGLRGAPGAAAGDDRRFGPGHRG